MADQDYQLKITRFDPKDVRLGRHRLHDSRSRRFAAPEVDPATLHSIRHEIKVPILNQGNVGSCTGHAITANMGGTAFWTAAREFIPTTEREAHEYAVSVYSDATRLDPWEGQYLPDDTGSDGLSVAKAMHNRGLISGYQHAFSLNAALTALASQPVIVGTAWLSSMYSPDRRDGKLIVQGYEDGGHEYCLDELDVERKRVWVRNSWGLDWGIGGRAWMSWADLGKLLANYGDCTILVPLSEPAPKPVEPEPPKPATPTDVELNLEAALRRLLDNRTCPSYLKGPGRAWLEDLAQRYAR